MLAEILGSLAWPLLAVVIAVCLGILARSADLLVQEAVGLSERSGIPKVIIGATIVSLGTTTPEAVVSVLAALQGMPGLALGNAVGSIICDTGLILGLACLISPLKLDRNVVNRQGWIQVGSGVLLVISCLPWANLGQTFSEGGRLPRPVGVAFVALLAGYMLLSVRWSRQENAAPALVRLEELEAHLETGPAYLLVLKLLAAVGLVVASSWVLIPAVAEAATRLHVPESIIAATLVAFGTSLPELVTSVTAARRGHGELAIGNVVGADILNVLFVAGTSAAVTAGGLNTPAHFFTLYFPSMLLVLLVFRVGVLLSGSHLKRPFGAILLGTYVVVAVLSYLER